MSPSRGGNQHKCDQVMFECMQKVAEIIVHSRLALPRPQGGRKSRVRVSALYSKDSIVYDDKPMNLSGTVFCKRSCSHHGLSLECSIHTDHNVIHADGCHACSSIWR
jgi:NAD-dependent dihydropyrimidine dehydrogenase PreA subunit